MFCALPTLSVACVVCPPPSLEEFALGKDYQMDNLDLIMMGIP